MRERGLEGCECPLVTYCSFFRCLVNIELTGHGVLLMLYGSAGVFEKMALELVGTACTITSGHCRSRVLLTNATRLN